MGSHYGTFDQHRDCIGYFELGFFIGKHLGDVKSYQLHHFHLIARAFLMDRIIRVAELGGHVDEIASVKSLY